MWVFEGAEQKTRSALAPPVGPLTEVQLLEAEMHFLSSHHWHPLVLAVQLAQSENRKHRSSTVTEQIKEGEG